MTWPRDPVPGDAAARAPRSVAGRRRGAGRRFLVVGDVLDAVIVHTAAERWGDRDPAADVRYRPAGAAGNTAAWLGWLGADVELVGRVGVDDVYRHERALEDAGVRAHLRYDARLGTGTVVAVENHLGRTAMSDPGAASRVTADDVPADVLGRADVVHLTGEAMLTGGGADGLRETVGRAVTAGARVAVDPSSALAVQTLGVDGFLRAVADAHLLFPGREEACALAGTDDVVAAAGALTAHVPLVVVTLGDQGALVARAGRPITRVAPTHAPIADRIGAGDAFAAGFLRAWATDPVRVGSAAREGTRVAARALGFVGGRPPV